MVLEKIIRLANKHLLLVRTLTFVWVLIIAVLCIIPQEDLPKAGGIPHFDKLVHFVLYFILAVLSLFVFHASKPSAKIFLLLSIFIFSLFIEVMQGILPFGRSFSGTDLLANLSGILAGLLLFQRKINTYPVK
jgi:VanZ family protein